MGKNVMKKVLAMLLAVSMCLTLIPGTAFATEVSDSVSTETEEAQFLSKDADAPVGMSVEVGKSNVTIHINRVGTSGTAQLVSVDAHEYYKGDKTYGMSKSTNAAGEVIAEYECGTAQDIKINRYDNDGKDHLYTKYYLVQNGKILSGPVYASDIYSLRSVEPFEMVTKKGLTLEDGSTIEMAKEMGVSNTVINMDLCTLILANEDANGNPIDNSRRSDVIEFESNGETFYFNEAYVRAQDNLISAYSQEGMNVSLVVISWAKTFTKDYPETLLYIPASEQRHTMAFNTSTERGRKYWIAAMEFMASRYSKKAGLVDKYIIGNEIDYTYDWNLLQPNYDSKGNVQRVEFQTFMEEYARTFRLANLAVKKYNSEAKVCVSLTHNWAVNCYDSYNATGTKTLRVNSYAPKEILDWLVKYETARGNFDWGLAVHPYPIGTTSSNPVKTDPGFSGQNGNPDPITGDWKTSPWITAANLELYQLYLQQPENKYNGELRTVSITETSICNLNEKSVTPEAYKTSTYEQAASIAQYYYRAANIECIDAIAYFQPHDQEGNKLGLMQQDGTKKPSYELWKYVDTNKTFSYANRYLKYIDSKAESYKDIMPAVKSDFNWDVMWDEDKIMVRTISTEDVVRSVLTDKDVYASDEAILVTAKGDVGDTVELYLAGDDIEKKEAIYSYPVQGTSNNVSYKSGNTYNILAYGTIASSRTADALLKAGDYKVVLRRGDTGEIISAEFEISKDYTLGNESLSVVTDKTVYKTGEDIIVTATGNSNCWVGIYKKDDAYGTGNTTSIYWYYINDPENGQISGKPTIIQSTIHNTDSSNPGAVIGAGEYKVYLFDGSSGNDYNVVKSVDITIEPKEVKPLTSVTYELDDDTDGFANGYVTVTKDADNEATTDCVMYWADADGNPLEGYTSLAKFKLKGTKTVQEIGTYTIIPEGAKKLIAYGSDGDSISDTAVSTELPEGCAYELGEANAEFQIISDTHVTTDKGATGEVKLANQHFKQMLEDVKANSPESKGIFIVGDVVNTGSETEFKKVYDLYQRSLNSGDGKLPELHISIGNHDWMAGNPNGQFQRYAKILNSSLKEAPENIYYDETVGGYHFIYLGGEEAGLRAVLSKEQIEWFDGRMQEITKEDPEKPVFVLLHQSFYNTVAGSLTGQGWDGVVNENSLKKVLKKYGQIILVNGHSHWELNSVSNMFAGDETLPVALNTASVGYLWSSYHVTGGEFEDGSHGYFVKVYDDKVVFFGRDFENSKYVPSAIHVIQRNDIETEADVYQISLDSEALNIDAKSETGSTIEYASTNPAIASVTEDGTIIPKKEGEVDIVITAYATDTRVMSRKTVTVKIGEASVYRISGKTRYETSLKIADALKEELGVEKFETVVVASGENFADALAGSYLAKQKNAPILMANEKNAESLKAYVKENLVKGGKVYLLGGTKALPDSVVNGLTGCEIERLKGATRYETNLEILKEAEVKSGEIVVCTGNGFADSLSVSAAGKPILLVAEELTDMQTEFLASMTDDSYYVIGGEGAVSADIAKTLETYGEVNRIGGKTRFETSVLVAEELIAEPEAAVLAYAMNFPDGLCGGPLAAAMKAPLILTMNGKEEAASAYTQKYGITDGAVLGGSGLISANAAKKAFNLDASTSIVDR